MPKGEPQPRTDEQRLSGAHFSITVGETEVQVRPLPLRKSEEWKRLLVSVQTEYGSVASSAGALVDAETAKQRYEALVIGAPNATASLVYRYLELAGWTQTREWFDDHATDQDVADAFATCMAVTFPSSPRPAPAGSPALPSISGT